MTTITPAIIFGTDGIRGPADQYPFDDYTLLRLGYAIALWAREKYRVEQPRLLIGMDTRVSCERIKKALIDGLVLGGVAVVDANVIPTPGVCSLIKNDTGFNAGVVISASHNHYLDNGIKLFDAEKCKLAKYDEDNLLFIMNEWRSESDLPPVGVGTKVVWYSAVRAYTQLITKHFKPGFLQGRTIALDLAHGATSVCAEAIFKQLGARVLVLNNKPNGTNINDNCGALHPEGLQALVLQSNADAGFAFDGDGDRIVAMNRQGELKDGDDILFLLLALPAYKAMLTVVGTVVSNRGLELACQKLGKEFIRTAVGDKYIAAALEEHQVLLGAENSGHVILKDYLLTGDGIFVALKLLEGLCINNNWQMEAFVKFPQITVNIPVVEKKSLSQEPFVSIIATYQERLDGGRLLVRYSGTEPLLRIMVEAQTSEVASEVAYELAEILRKELST